MTWLIRRRLFWLLIAVCWVIILASQAFIWSTRHAMRTASRTPPTIPCKQGMTLLPGQSCYGSVVIMMRARREETSY